jgi:hypothetical protein
VDPRPETAVADAARELSVGLVAHSPLGRGFLTGTVDTAALAANDGRRRLARFSADAAAANQAITDEVRKIAEAKGVTAHRSSSPGIEVASDLWGSRTRPLWLTWAFYAARSYSLRRPPRTGRRLTRTRGEVSDTVIGYGGVELVAAVRSPAVVAGLVLG